MLQAALYALRCRKSIARGSEIRDSAELPTPNRLSILTFPAIARLELVIVSALSVASSGQARGETTRPRCGGARYLRASTRVLWLTVELAAVRRFTPTLTLLHHRPLFELQYINQSALKSID